MEKVKNKYHTTLAEYFAGKPLYLDEEKTKLNTRKLVELPWQQTKAEMWDEVTETLCDLYFVEAKCVAEMTFALIDDYRFALDGLPERRAEVEEEKQRKERINKWTREITEYSSKWSERRDRLTNGEVISEREPQLPEPPISVTCTLDPEPASGLNSWTRLEKMVAWTNFVSNNASQLIAGKEPVFQLAYNSVESGPVDDALKELLAQSRGPAKPWFALINRPKFLLHPACLKTFVDNNFIAAVTATPDMRIVVTGSDNAVRVWNLENGENYTLHGHRLRVTAIDIIPDGRSAISGSEDGMLCFWDLIKGTKRDLMGHTKKINSISMTPDGRYAVSVSEDRTMYFWDLENGDGRAIKTLKNAAKSVVLTPDGRKIVSGGDAQPLCITDIQNGTDKELGSTERWISTISTTPDGQYVVSANWNFWLMISDLKNKCSRTIDEPCGARVLRITPDGKHAISAGGQDDRNMLRVWNLETGKSRVLAGHTASINDLYVTPDGRYAISVSAMDHTLRVWDLELGENTVLVEHKSSVLSLAVLPDGCSVASAADYPDNTIRIWNPENGESRVLNGHTNNIDTVCVTPDGKRAISVAGDCTLRIWNIQTGEGRLLNKEQCHIRSVSLLPDGKQIITAERDKNLHIWNLTSGDNTILTTLNVDIQNLFITPDGKCVVFFCGNAIVSGRVKIFDLVSGEIHDFPDLASDKINVFGESHWISPLSLTPDGRNVILWSKAQRSLYSGHLATGEVTFIAKNNTAQDAICFAPNGQYAFSKTSRWFSETEANTVHLWNVNKNEIIASYCSNAGIVRAIAILNFPTLVIGMSSGQVQFLRPIGKSDGIPLSLMGPLITTSIRLWLHDQGLDGGQWDEQIRTFCPWCRQRFPTPHYILEIIASIARNAQLKPNESPCLHLPNEAWTDPHLISNCPNCGGQLKFNPFIVDNRNA